MTSEAAPGALGLRPRSHARATTLRDSDFPLPSGSIVTPHHVLEPLNVSEPLRDVIRFIGALLFITGFGTGFFAFLFVLLFSEIH